MSTQNVREKSHKERRQKENRKRGKTIEKLNNGERRNVLYSKQRRKNRERGPRGKRKIMFPSEHLNMFG